MSDSRQQPLGILSTINHMTYTLFPLRADVADTYRIEGGIVVHADTNPGYPCRQCLRDAEVGEALLLVSHDPFLGSTPYRSPSAIFIHREPCGSPASLVGIAEQQRRRQLSVRAFDRHELMVQAHVIDGTDLDQALNDLLVNSEIDRVDVHNAPQGCWAMSARRADTTSEHGQSA